METAKISSQRKFKSIRAAIICSRKPTKIANPQNKSPPPQKKKFHASRYVPVKYMFNN